MALDGDILYVCEVFTRKAQQFLSPKCQESLWTGILDLPLVPHPMADGLISNSQLEAEIEAARLRVTDWTRLRRHPSRSRSLSHASVSTTASSLLSCSTIESGATDASFLNVATDGTTGSSCHSSCSSTCGIQLPSEMAAKLSAATLISAFLAASHDFNQEKTQDSTAADKLTQPVRAQTPDQFSSSSRSRSNRSASPSSH
uniref:Uncharacterized protein n=1 Tax=Trichobilharzia regenti TaxID=157069 RepID=A0AA85J0N4_TRIRE|nr:unnamed protein product [Trichobilharzia regenti]